MQHIVKQGLCHWRRRCATLKQPVLVTFVLSYCPPMIVTYHTAADTTPESVWLVKHLLSCWPAVILPRPLLSKVRKMYFSVTHGIGHITAGLMESSIEVLRNLHTKLCMESLDGNKKKVCICMNKMYSQFKFGLQTSPLVSEAIQAVELMRNFMYHLELVKVGLLFHCILALLSYSTDRCHPMPAISCCT